MRLLKSRVLAFVPCATADIALKQGPVAPITEGISRTFAGLCLEYRAFDPELYWIQASFTSQVDVTCAGPIRMRQDPQQL